MAADEIVNSAKAGLQTKIGGLPFYVYGAGAVIVVYLWKRHKDNSAATNAADVSTSPDGTPDSLAYQSPSPGIGGPTPTYTTNAPNPDNSNGDTGTINELQDWISRGTEYLISIGYNGTTANAALAGFASGQQVTGIQQRLVDLWISRPEGGAAPGAKPVVGTGPGVSYNVPSNITINPISGWTVVHGKPLHYQVIWKDAYGTPVTGTLVRWGNAGVVGGTFLVRESVAVKNGIADVTLPVNTSGSFIYKTLPLDPKYSQTQSVVVKYTVTAPPPAVKHGPPPKKIPAPVKRH